MGTYIYGVSKSKKVKTNIGDVHHCKFIMKPYWGWEQNFPLVVGLMTRINKAWGEARPRFIVLSKELFDGADVLDLSTRKTWEGNPVPCYPVFDDEPYGFGKRVGKLTKVGKKWEVV